jgi:hypothetical protein
MTSNSERQAWTKFVEQREVKGKKKRPKKKEPTPQEKADAEQALNSLTEERKP